MDNLNKKETEALKLIRNSIIHTGTKPTYKKMMHCLNYQSPRSVNLIIKSLFSKGYLKYDDDGNFLVPKYTDVLATKTVNIPVIGQISCGALNLSEEHFENWIELSSQLAPPPYDYFILKTYGDSMNKRGIFPDSLILIRSQHTARNGEIVVAMVNGDCTLKEFHRENDFIILKPNSNNEKYKPTLLTSDFTILGVMVCVLPSL